MKKSVMIIIGVIYVMAIMLVSFMGLQIETFNETIYVANIEVTNEENTRVVDDEKWIVFTFDDTDSNQNVIQLEWKVTPDNATRKNVEFIYDEENAVATVSSFGAVKFNEPGAISIKIAATDGSGKSVNVTVFARKAK